jgi:predicted enzyme related to lactoylglutathione lyase
MNTNLPIEENPVPQIGFIKLTVADLDRSRTFYNDAFGMTAGDPIVQRDLVEQVIKSPDNPFAVTLLQYHDRRPIVTSEGAAAFCVGFYVDDMDAALEQAQGAGAMLLRGPFRFGEAVSYAFLEDPDGHVIEVIYRGGESQRRD